MSVGVDCAQPGVRSIAGWCYAVHAYNDVHHTTVLPAPSSERAPMEQGAFLSADRGELFFILRKSHESNPFRCHSVVLVLMQEATARERVLGFGSVTHSMETRSATRLLALLLVLWAHPSSSSCDASAFLSQRWVTGYCQALLLLTEGRVEGRVPQRSEIIPVSLLSLQDDKSPRNTGS